MEDTQATSRPYGLFETKGERRSVFFFVFMGVFAMTYGLLALVDFLPEQPGDVVSEETEDVLVPAEEIEYIVENTEDTATAAVAGVTDARTGDLYPVSIYFESLDREVSVSNPSSTDVATLDEALLHGAVRYPESADFSEEGTMFLLGHSSYLPNVFNKNFQAFNGIQKLTWGDKIYVRSESTTYEYRVDRVYEATATAGEVTLVDGEARLVLATCNSFGSKDDRFIVEATLVATEPR
ncbi:sortase [Candidatus Kaiserbacteria bacterium]|nr:sortase [Candidatus Kaiserbacteria bacterium]